MATKTKAPKMTPEEALALLPRKADRWKILSRAALVLGTKKKVVESAMKDAVDSLDKPYWEGRGVRAKRVKTSPVKKSDEQNIALVLAEVEAEHLDIVAPRAINAEALEALYPELAKKMKCSKGNRFEVDLLQAALEKK